MNERYAQAKYADVPEQIRGLFETLPKTRRGIYLHGEVGTGKTHIAHALHNASREAIGVKSRVWAVPELLRALRADFERKGADKERVDEEMMEYRGLLILDDLGAEKLSDWVLEVIYLVLNRRYNAMLPTIITSNLPVSELAERIGDRSASRIIEMCDIVELVGGDRRLKSGKKIKINV